MYSTLFMELNIMQVFKFNTNVISFPECGYEFSKEMLYLKHFWLP